MWPRGIGLDGRILGKAGAAIGATGLKGISCQCLTSPPTFSQMSAISLMKVILVPGQSNKGANEVGAQAIILPTFAGLSFVGVGPD
jgi:hypothetical protein